MFCAVNLHCNEISFKIIIVIPHSSLCFSPNLYTYFPAPSPPPFFFHLVKSVAFTSPDPFLDTILLVQLVFIPITSISFHPHVLSSSQQESEHVSVVSAPGLPLKQACPICRLHVAGESLSCCLPPSLCFSLPRVLAWPWVQKPNCHSTTNAV